MAPPTKKLSAPRLSPLRNEGEALPTQVVAGPDGQNTLQLELTSLPAPEKTFTANHLDIVEDVDGGKRIVFWMSNIYEPGARALLEILMSKEAALNFSRTLDILKDKVHLAGKLVGLEKDPKNAVAMTANFVRMNVNELGAAIDFYYASPFSMTHAAKTSYLHVQGLARVQTSNAVCFAVVKHFLGILEQAS